MVKFLASPTESPTSEEFVLRRYEMCPETCELLPRKFLDPVEHFMDALLVKVNKRIASGLTPWVEISHPVSQGPRFAGTRASQDEGGPSGGYA